MRGTQLAVFSLSILAWPASGQLRYTIESLGTITHDRDAPRGINNAGHAVGCDGSGKAYLYLPGMGKTDLTTAGVTFCPTAINDLGQIVGGGFVYTPGVGIRTLGTLGGPDGTTALGINDAGHVVGVSDTLIQHPNVPIETVNHAFLQRPGELPMDLGALANPNWYSRATGVNRNGQIAGTAIIGPLTNPNHAFLYTPGVGIFDIDTLNSVSSEANALNSSAQVVGSRYVPELAARLAFIYSPSTGMRNLGTLGGSYYSEAFAINGRTEVVGSSSPSDTAFYDHAFIYSPELGGMRDLNSFVVNGAGWELTTATGINDAGSIIGAGQFGGQTHAFLLTPTPCAPTLSPSSALYGFTGGSGNIVVNLNASCSWTAFASASWVKIISGSTGNGSGVVFYTVDPNTVSTPRTASIQIGGQLFAVTQTFGKADLSVTITKFINYVPTEPSGVDIKDTGGWWSTNLPAAVTLNIRNIGVAAASPVRLVLSLRMGSQSKQLSQFQIQGLAPGQTLQPSSRLYAFSLPAGPPVDGFFGSVVLAAELDPTFSVADDNITNNVDTRALVLVDPRPSRIEPATITLSPTNTIPNDFPSMHAAESILPLIGYGICNVAPIAGWTKPLTGNSIRSRRDGQLKPASAFRGDAVVAPRANRFVITFQGGQSVGEPNPCEFFEWDNDPLNGYVRTWHSVY